MNDGAIADLLVVVGVLLVPLVRVDFEQSFHEKLRPELHQVACPWQNRHLFIVTRNAIIDFNQTLLSHESEFDPVFATW